MSRKIGLLGAAALTVALLAPAPAHADQWGSDDPSGDVDGFHFDPDPQPCGTSTALDTSAEGNEDITHLGVRHSRRTVVVTTRFADLASDKEQILDISLRASTGGYDLELYREAPSTGAWEATCRPSPNSPIPTTSRSAPASG